MRLSIPTVAAVAFTAANLMPVLDAGDARAQSPSSMPSSEPSTSSPARSPVKPPAGTAAIPDEKLDAEAAAIQQVAGVKQAYQQRIATASPQDRQKLAEEGNAAMKKAVTDHGLSVEEYTSILQVAQNDPAVHQKLMERIGPPAPLGQGSPMQKR